MNEKIRNCQFLDVQKLPCPKYEKEEDRECEDCGYNFPIITFKIPEGLKCIPSKPCVVPDEDCDYIHEGLCGKDKIELVF